MITHPSFITQELYLGNNAISSVPGECLEPLVELTILELRDNKVTDLPLQIQFVSRLERLDLTNNDLTKFVIFFYDANAL